MGLVREPGGTSCGSKLLMSRGGTFLLTAFPEGMKGLKGFTAKFVSRIQNVDTSIVLHVLDANLQSQEES